MTKTKYNVLFLSIGMDCKRELILKSFLDIGEAFEFLEEQVEPFRNADNEKDPWTVYPLGPDPDNPDRYDICLLKTSPKGDLFEIYVGTYLIVEETWEVDTEENAVEETSEPDSRKEKYRAKLYEAVDIMLNYKFENESGEEE